MWYCMVNAVVDVHEAVLGTLSSRYHLSSAHGVDEMNEWLFNACAHQGKWRLQMILWIYISSYN